MLSTLPACIFWLLALKYFSNYKVDEDCCCQYIWRNGMLDIFTPTNMELQASKHQYQYPTPHLPTYLSISCYLPTCTNIMFMSRKYSSLSLSLRYDWSGNVPAEIGDKRKVIMIHNSAGTWKEKRLTPSRRSIEWSVFHFTPAHRQ